jgi:hypothetical protein
MRCRSGGRFEAGEPVYAHEGRRCRGTLGYRAGPERRKHPGSCGGCPHVAEILSANSGRRRESGEARYACLGPRQAIQPVHDPRYVHRGGGTNLLERGFRQPDVAAPAHPEGAHAL